MFSPPVQSVTAETGKILLDLRTGDVERLPRTRDVAHEEVEQHPGHRREPEQRAQRPWRSVGITSERSWCVAQHGLEVPLRLLHRRAHEHQPLVGSARWVGSSAVITDTWLPGSSRCPPERTDTGTATTSGPPGSASWSSSHCRSAAAVRVITTSLTVISKWFLTSFTSASGIDPNAKRR